jgi:predicted metal-dependent hydrolase
MTTEDEKSTHAISFGKENIGFSLKRSDRRTLAITVRPDTSVVVTAPKKAAIQTIKAKVRKRVVWILRQRAFFEEYLPPVLPRHYIGGETHRYLGRQYRLKIAEGTKESVTLNRPHICIAVRNKKDTNRVKRLVDTWFTARARIAFERSLVACLPTVRAHVTSTPKLLLRRMPKRWGSWTKRGAIYLNPELVKAPRSCIDYVITHELCHLVHGNHGEDFYNLLRRVMPDWEERKARLERTAVS